MEVVTRHGEGGSTIVRNASEPTPEPEERNAAIRKEYRKLDEKKLQAERKKKTYLRILTAISIMAITAAANVSLPQTIYT